MGRPLDQPNSGRTTPWRLPVRGGAWFSRKCVRANGTLGYQHSRRFRYLLSRYFKFRARINTATLENRRNGCGVNTVVGLTDAAGRRLSVALTCFVIGAMLELRTMPRQGAQPRRSAVAEHAGAGPGELTKQNGTPPAAHRRWVDAAAPGPGSAPLDGHVAGPATQSSCQSLKIRPRG